VVIQAMPPKNRMGLRSWLVKKESGGLKMETRVTGRKMRQTSHGMVKMLLGLTLGGGAVFWATSIATSLLPLAAEYRAAYSNWSVQTVWVGSLLMGMVIGGCVSYALLRSIDKNPARDPILRSVIFSFIALVIAILLIDVPQSFLVPGSSDTWYYFLIGVLFNAVRFLLLGVTIGYLYKKMVESPKFAYMVKGDKK
jgi:hypothetical protein